MASSRKLIFAAAMLAVGYGVASFLGSPHAPYLSPATRAAIEAHAKERASQPPPIIADPTSSLTSARLIPAAEPSNSLDENGARPQTFPVGSESNPFITSLVRADNKAPTNNSASPALLPKAIDAEPLVPSAMQNVDAFTSSATPPAIVPVATNANLQTATLGLLPERDWRGGQLVDAHWNAPDPSVANPAPGAVTIGSTPILSSNIATASFAAPSASVSGNSPLAPRRLPEIAGMVANALPSAALNSTPHYSGDLRAHIVVDGDSLEKLAGRYLNDSARGVEIFDLNRALLQSPELLPIGAELKIPPRPAQDPSQVAATSFVGNLAPESSPNHTSTLGVVPIRPVPVDSANVPRAQLLRPLPAGWSQDVAE